MAVKVGISEVVTELVAIKQAFVRPKTFNVFKGVELQIVKCKAWVDQVLMNLIAGKKFFQTQIKTAA